MSSALPSWVRHPVAIPLGVALLAVALLGGVTSVAIHESNHTVERDAQSRMRSNRDAAVRALVHQTDDFKRTVATWSANTVVIDGLRAATPASLGQVQAQLSTLAHTKNSPAAFVADRAGRIVAIYPAQPELLGKSFSFRDWYQGVSRTGRPYVSAAYSSAANGHPLVVGVAAPVLDGSRRVGYVTVLWQLDSVRTVAEGSKRDDGVTITVTDQFGQPLTGALIVDDLGQPLQSAVSATTKQALAGRSVSVVNAGKIEAAGPVPGIGWTVTATLPTSVALAPAANFQRSLQVTLGVALLLVLLFTVLALRFARGRVAEQAAMRAAESALRASEDRFRRVFDEAISGELLVNNQGEASTRPWPGCWAASHRSSSDNRWRGCSRTRRTSAASAGWSRPATATCSPRWPFATARDSRCGFWSRSRGCLKMTTKAFCSHRSRTSPAGAPPSNGSPSSPCTMSSPACPTAGC